MIPCLAYGVALFSQSTPNYILSPLRKPGVSRTLRNAHALTLALATGSFEWPFSTTSTNLIPSETSTYIAPTCAGANASAPILPLPPTTLLVARPLTPARRAAPTVGGDLSLGPAFTAIPPPQVSTPAIDPGGMRRLPTSPGSPVVPPSANVATKPITAPPSRENAPVSRPTPIELRTFATPRRRGASRRTLPLALAQPRHSPSNKPTPIRLPLRRVLVLLATSPPRTRSLRRSLLLSSRSSCTCHAALAPFGLASF